MPVHPDLAARLRYLDGLSSLGEAYRKPELMHEADWTAREVSARAGVDVRQVLVRGMLHGFLDLPAECAPVTGCLDEIAVTVGGVR